MMSDFQHKNTDKTLITDESDLDFIRKYTEAYNKAYAEGDKAGQQAAHDAAEKIRAKYDYSGGVDGSEYIKLGTGASPAKADTSWLDKLGDSNYNYDQSGQISAKLDALLNRTPFSYDAASDPLYQQYRKQYTREADRSAEDVLGKAAVMTGGMPSTAAVAASQQASDYQMSQMTDKIPELQQLAYSMYQDKLSGDRADLNTLIGIEDNNYNRWLADRNYLYQLARDQVGDQQTADALAYRFARFDNSLGESGRKAIRGSYQEGKDTAQHVADFLPAYNAGVEGKANPNPTNETAYAGYVAGQNDAKKAAGTGEHIDSRTKENVSGRNVNAFQFDHPELHSYYSAAAEQLSGIADISLSRGQQKGARQRTANGYQRNNQIFETPAMRKAMDEGLTRTQIIDAAQRIVNDNGQENVKAAKTLEIVLDDMLTNGYTAVDGTAVAPNTDYIAAKQQIAGAEVQATGFDKYVTDNRLALETGEVTMDELRAEYAQQEGAEHGEAVHLRDGSERDNGANPRREVRGVEESTGRDQGRKKGRRFADGEAASLDYGEKVSTASFGIGRGAFNDSVYLVKNETAEMRKAKDLAKERGLRVTFFAGNNLTFRDKSGKTFQVRGYVSGDRVFIRADHPEFTSYQIMRHEAGHDMIARGEVDLNEVRTRIDKTFTSGEIDSLCTAYTDAYSGTGMTAQEIWEEVVCDSLGDMNIFADSEISDAAAFLLAHIKVESETVVQESSRALPRKTASNFDNREVSGNDRTGTHGNGSAVQKGRQDGAGEQAVQGASGTVSRGDALHGRDRGRREVTSSFGETPVRAWTDGNTVTPGQGTVAYQEQQTAMEYGIPSFVVSDEIWKGAYCALSGERRYRKPEGQKR